MPPKATILFPVQSLYPAQNGGPDNTVYWLAKALAKDGFSPVLASTDIGLPEEVERGRWLETDYGRVVYSRNPHFYVPAVTVARALSVLAKADVLHLSLMSYPAAWGPAIVNALVTRKPIVWSIRGELDPIMLLRSPRKKDAVLWLIRRLLRSKQAPIYFHTTCEAETEYVRNNFGQLARIIEIPNYMELPELVEHPTAPPPAGAGADAAGSYLIFVGRIDKKKAIENLIAALPLSPAFVSSDWDLRIVGDADNAYGHGLRARVEELGLGDRVRFLGHRSGVEKQALLAGARGLVMPSHTENFGIVVSEALAQGTPAIASTGTPWAILEQYGAGWWSDNTPGPLARAIEELVAQDETARTEMRKRALELVRDEFDIYNHIDQWRAAYARVLES